MAEQTFRLGVIGDLPRTGMRWNTLEGLFDPAEHYSSAQGSRLAPTLRTTGLPAPFRQNRSRDSRTRHTHENQSREVSTGAIIAHKERRHIG